MVNKIIKALGAPSIVFLVHLIILYSGIYDLVPKIDILMHFLGGASIALMFSLLLKLAEDKKQITFMHKGIRFLFVISFVALIAMLWEFLEFSLGIAINFQSQLSIADTMGDLLMGLLGASVGYLLANCSMN